MILIKSREGPWSEVFRRSILKSHPKVTWFLDFDSCDTEQDSLAPPLWRDRFGAAVLAQNVLAQRRFGAGRFGATTGKQRHKYKLWGVCLRPSLPVKECGLKVFFITSSLMNSVIWGPMFNSFPSKQRHKYKYEILGSESLFTTISASYRMRFEGFILPHLRLTLFKSFPDLFGLTESLKVTTNETL